MSDLKKNHDQLEHVIATQMKTYLCEADRCDSFHIDLLHINVRKCSCALTAPPTPRSICSASVASKETQAHLFINLVYFNMTPFLYSIDARTKWPEIDSFRTRRLKEQIDVLKRIQLYLHGLSKIIRGD